MPHDAPTEMSDTSAFQSFGIGYDGRRWQSALNVGGASAFTASIQLDGLSVTSGTIKIKCAWNRNKTFLTRSFSVTTKDGVALEGKEVIGWDQSRGVLRSLR